MIKVIIVDDEPLAAELIQEYLNEYPDFEVIDICGNGFDALKQIQSKNPDLVFLDVEMPKLNGLELLELLENPPAIVFCTAYDQFAVSAFEFQAIDYLLKPFSKERFKKAIGKYKGVSFQNRTSEQFEVEGILHRIVLKDKNDLRIISLEEILYLEANDDYVNIYTTNGKFLKNKTMSFFERSLPPSDFCRIHRSYIIKINQMNKIESYDKEGYCVKLTSGQKIPMSKNGYAKLRLALGL
jgi:two-component system, LytTR family, response regulator